MPCCDSYKEPLSLAKERCLKGDRATDTCLPNASVLATFTWRLTALRVSPGNLSLRCKLACSLQQGGRVADVTQEARWVPVVTCLLVARRAEIMSLPTYVRGQGDKCWDPEWCNKGSHVFYYLRNPGDLGFNGACCCCCRYCCLLFFICFKH